MTQCLLKDRVPSIEEHQFTNIEANDNVLSIHCKHWPNDALEWCQRRRPFGWPSSSIIASVISFGYHLVPIGHPNSQTRFTEWRISFSLAERTLVWSFNHTQMQCYAVMKIILKEFIKKNCFATKPGAMFVFYQNVFILEIRDHRYELLASR